MLAHYKMRNILEKMEKWQELINVQKKIIKLVPNTKKQEEENKLIGYTYEYGRVSLEQGDIVNAERIFSSLVKSNPNFIPSYLGMVEVHISKGEIEEAISLIDKGYNEQKSKILLLRLEDLLISIGDPKRLIQFYLRAINNSPNDNELKILLGRAYYRLEMIDDAIEILSSIDSTACVNPMLNCIKGLLYLRRNQINKALSEFKELCPENKVSSIYYKCKVCNSLFDEWAGRCSVCGSWNSFEIDLRGCGYSQ
ncbi:MAG: tetratricopeptide repeat protein [Thermodesulfovibrio sp.]|nr:tetratricopeptide repeat protein [Thermodesulfovibrio sp.]